MKPGKKKRPHREHWFGIDYAQNRGTVNAFNEFLTKEEFHTVIELGTGKGGLSIVFALYAVIKRGVFYTFDVSSKKLARKVLPRLGANYELLDIFNEEGKIAMLIGRPTKILVLCDDGNKPKEFNTFVKYLKSGDFIMSHDYVPYPESPRECEICNADVEESMLKYHLEFAYESLFNPLRWLCARKD
jgi:cephalosporin hydroxylase